jgi:hypothetical protein
LIQILRINMTAPANAGFVPSRGTAINQTLREDDPTAAVSGPMSLDFTPPKRVIGEVG